MSSLRYIGDLKIPLKWYYRFLIKGQKVLQTKIISIVCETLKKIYKKKL